MQHLTAPELATWLQDASRDNPILLDVREPWEFETCHIAGSQLVPMNTVPANTTELEAGRPIVCICHHGVRSMHVATYLEQQGFSRVINLTGGVHAWAQQVDGSMPTY